MLILDKLDWFCLFIKLASCVVKRKELCYIGVGVSVPEYTVFEIFWVKVTISFDMLWEIVY
jgi:hypothetical protein